MYRFLLVFSVPFDFIVLCIVLSLIAISNRTPSSGGKQLVFYDEGYEFYEFEIHNFLHYKRLPFV